MALTMMRPALGKAIDLGRPVVPKLPRSATNRVDNQQLIVS